MKPMPIELPQELEGYEYDMYARMWVRKKAIIIPKVTLAEHHLYFCPTHGDKERQTWIDTEGSRTQSMENHWGCAGTWQLASPYHIKTSTHILDFVDGIRNMHPNPNYTGAL